MLGKLHNKDALRNFEDVQGQVTIERELQQFFKITPPLKIEGEFSDISGSASDQFLYLNLILKVIEELDIEPVQAFALLEAIRPVIYRKFEAITDRFIGKVVTPGAKTTSIVFEAIEVFTRLTDTYDSIIEEAKHFGDSQAFMMGSAIHRALADKARLVQCYLQTYQEVPVSVWRHINWLYRNADEFNIFNQVMQDKLAFPNHALTIRQLYIYTILLSSAGTRSINADEISALAELLKDWVKSVVIRKYDAERDQVRLCMDPLKMHTPILNCTQEQISSPSLFCIDIDKISEKLQRSHVHQKFVDGKRYTLTQWTAYKIFNNWTRFAERSSVRHVETDDQHINAYVGLLMTWLINPPDSVRVEDTGFSDREFRDRKLHFNLADEKIKLDRITKLQPDKFPPLKPRVIDYSNTGYCLQWEEGQQAKIAIDEIILLEDERNDECCLCQVVWIKATSRTGFQTGVSIVSSEVIPVLTRIIPSSHGFSDRKISKGFIICHKINDRKNYGIFFENVGWRTGQAVELMLNSQTICARLLEPLGQSEKYQSFNIAFFQD